MFGFIYYCRCCFWLKWKCHLPGIHAFFLWFWIARRNQVEKLVVPTIRDGLSCVGYVSFSQQHNRRFLQIVKATKKRKLNRKERGSLSYFALYSSDCVSIIELCIFILSRHSKQCPKYFHFNGFRAMFVSGIGCTCQPIQLIFSHPNTYLMSVFVHCAHAHARTYVVCICMTSLLKFNFLTNFDLWNPLNNHKEFANEMLVAKKKREPRMRECGREVDGEGKVRAQKRRSSRKRKNRRNKRRTCHSFRETEGKSGGKYERSAVGERDRPSNHR